MCQQVGSRLLDEAGNTVRELDLGPHVKDQEDAHLGVLAQETVSGGHAVLIFCATRKVCGSNSPVYLGKRYYMGTPEGMSLETFGNPGLVMSWI
jgi:hypothetical protein